MTDHDIVILTEIKRAKLNHAPGFIPVVAKNQNSQRGGVAILFKQEIYQEVTAIDTTAQEQIWFQLRTVPGMKFGGVYIPPSDSPFFSSTSFAEIQARTQDSAYGYIVAGDMNTRCGDLVNDLVKDCHEIYYRPVDKTVNSNGKAIVQVCKDNNLVALNNLYTDVWSYPSSLTYRKKDKWISEVDYCFSSIHCINCATNLKVVQSTDLPSDHAPMSIDLSFPEEMIDAKVLLQRAQ